MQKYPESMYEHRVSYGETDTMGVLYYGEYLHIFERSRSQYIRALGMSYKEVEAKGFFLPVRQASCRYRTPARYDDLLAVKVVVQELRRASIIFGYEVHHQETGSWIASGVTEHAFVDGTGKPVGVPKWFGELLGK